MTKDAETALNENSGSRISELERQIAVLPAENSVLQEQRDRYLNIIKVGQLGFACCRLIVENQIARDFSCTEANPLFEEATGMRGLSGKRISDVFPKIKTETRDWLELFVRVAQGGKSEQIEWQLPGSDNWLSIAVISPQPGDIIVVAEKITSQKHDQVQLAYQSTLLNNVSDAIVASDNQYRFTYWNSAAEALYGWSAEEVLGKMGGDIVQTQYGEAERSVILQAIANQQPWQGEATQQRKDGSRFPVDVSSLVLSDADGNIIGYLTISRDISERKKLENKLRASEELYRLLVNYSQDAIMVATPQGHFISANPAALQIFGWTEDELRQGEDYMWLDRSDPIVQAGLAERARTGRYFGELIYVRKDGSKFPGEVSSAIYKDKDGQDQMGLLIRDISERKNAENALNAAHEQLKRQMEAVQKLQAELREQAVRDPLTGLYNRRFLNEILPHELLHARRDHEALSVIIADIDHFKNINDTYGHQAGDQILREVADLFRKSTRSSDFVFRIGGEEFLILLLNSNDEGAFAHAEDVREICLKTNFIPETYNLKITMSFGLSTYPKHGEMIDELIARADKALYTSKNSGRNRVTVWSEE